MLAKDATSKKTKAILNQIKKNTAPLTSEQVDNRHNYTPHFVTAVSPMATQRLQAVFLQRKKMAGTYIWATVASILIIRLTLPLGELPLLGVILLATYFCLKKYCSYCKCPSCEVSLVGGNNKWRMPTAGFSSKICPRCELCLKAKQGPPKLTDAQAKKLSPAYKFR